MEYENWHVLGIPYTTFFTLSVKTAWFHLIVLLKLSGYNIMSSSRWLEKFGRISVKMKILHILGGTPYYSLDQCCEGNGIRSDTFHSGLYVKNIINSYSWRDINIDITHPIFWTFLPLLWYARIIQMNGVPQERRIIGNPQRGKM